LQNYNLILASGSPRRKQILAEAGINFTVKPADINEDNYPSDLSVYEVPAYLAKLKAEAITTSGAEIVLAADTVVIIDNKILGKPSDSNDAFNILKQLSGRMHEVVTGVCIKSQDEAVIFSETTEVYFKELNDEEVLFYIDKFKPFDKAGGYGIQEWIGMIGVEKINGSFYNVMGLPIATIYQHLKTF